MLYLVQPEHFFYMAQGLLEGHALPQYEWKTGGPSSLELQRGREGVSLAAIGEADLSKPFSKDLVTNGFFWDRGAISWCLYELHLPQQAQSLVRRDH